MGGEKHLKMLEYCKTRWNQDDRAFNVFSFDLNDALLLENA